MSTNVVANIQQPMTMDDIRNNPISREEVMALMVGTGKLVDNSTANLTAVANAILDCINNRYNEMAKAFTSCFMDVVNEQKKYMDAQKQSFSVLMNKLDSVAKTEERIAELINNNQMAVDAIEIQKEKNRQINETRYTTKPIPVNDVKWSDVCKARLEKLAMSISKKYVFSVNAKEINLIMCNRLYKLLGSEINDLMTNKVIENPGELLGVCVTKKEWKEAYETVLSGLEDDIKEFTDGIMNMAPSMMRHYTPPMMKMLSREVFPDCADRIAVSRLESLAAVDFMKKYRDAEKFCYGDYTKFIKKRMKEASMGIGDGGEKLKYSLKGQHGWMVMYSKYTKPIIYDVARRYLFGRS